MGVNYFTDEQVQELKMNPYVKNVTYKTITYDESFKEKFLLEYKNGVPPTIIFANCGFDKEVLGQIRIDTFTARVKKQNERLEGFTDTRKSKSGRTKGKDLTDGETIAILKQKNKNLQQENDFLKRVRFINKKQILKMQKGRQQ